MLRPGLVAAVLVMSSVSAHAEAIQARDMMFILPRIGHAWDQKTFGTEGKVILANGFNWQRYRVLFDNGAELGDLDQRHIEPAGRAAKRIAKRARLAARAG